MKLFSTSLAASLLLTSSLSFAADKISLPYEAFELSNGLRVVVHEDRKAPLVAVSIWYHVGSKDEPEGKTGFAHLFEHLPGLLGGHEALLGVLRRLDQHNESHRVVSFMSASTHATNEGSTNRQRRPEFFEE